jgi:hypothetical protein
MTDASTRQCFADEAGDATLFSARGKVLVGEEGCSRYFMLGALELEDAPGLARELAALRAALLSDPYFRAVPSMQPERRKTAIAFHAKDDLPEVRREVFQVLMRHDLKFNAVVRDKARVLAMVEERNRFSETYRYQPNELYDSLVSRLFKNRLHLSPEVEVCFASRGRSDRSAALQLALKTARARFEAKTGLSVETSIKVREALPPSEPALQAVDYLLWALQRHYERGESRFVELIWPKVGLVHAVDETAEAAYGVYYTKRKPLGHVAT